MARRSYPLTLRCAHEGCRECARYSFDSQRACVESWEYKTYIIKKHPYLCCRHSHGDGVLTPTNQKAEWISEPAQPCASARPDDPYRHFGGHGVLIGPGFYASGADFPTGTRIKVTAEVILPTNFARVEVPNVR